MNKKIALFFVIVSILTCLLAISVSAQVITFDSYEEKTILTYDATELVTFDDGCSYPSYYIFTDSTGFATNYEWLNAKAEKSYTDANVVELCVPTGVVTGGYFKVDSSFTNLLKLNTGKTLTKTNGDFYQNQTLTHVTFGEGYTNEGLGSWFFNGGKVEYVVFADGSNVTTLPSQFFANLSTLKGLYLGSSITNIGSGTFTNMGSSNVFLMNTPSDTEASEVYYFKSTLVEGNFYGFKTNATTTTWVFPSTVNGISSGWNIDNSENIPQNFVFLTSNASSVVVNNAIGGSKFNSTNFYFPNISSENATVMSIVPKTTYYFGVDAMKGAYNGSWGEFTAMADSDHIHDINSDLNQAPSCNEAGKIETYCFCKKTLSSTITEEALGHDNNGAEVLGIAYSDITQKGVKTFKCNICKESATTPVNAILTGYLGYSTPTDESRKGITFGYDINIEALNEYKAFNTTLEFGFIVAVEAFLGENAPLDKNGVARENVIKAPILGTYNRVDFILEGDIWEQEIELKEGETVLASQIAFLMCAYSYSESTGVQYIQDSCLALEGIKTISYEEASSQKAE